MVSQIKLKESLGWVEEKGATQKDVGNSMLRYDTLRSLSKKMKREESRYSSLDNDSQEENDLFLDSDARPKSALLHSRNQRVRSNVTSGLQTLSNCKPAGPRNISLRQRLAARSTTVDDYTQMTIENRSTTDSKLLQYHTKQNQKMKMTYLERVNLYKEKLMEA